MTVKKFLVEVDYTPYEDYDHVERLLIEEGVTEIMKTVTLDGEIIDFNGINVKEL